MPRDPKELDWYSRAGRSHCSDGSGIACLQCRRPFVARLFDPEMQLAASGWQKRGAAWVCRKCVEREMQPPRPPKPVTVCMECRASFGIAFASDAEKMQKGWQRLGDGWVCGACAKAIAEEDGG